VSGARTSDAPRLSRDRAVATAIRLLDEKGADALSMRGLARALGVPPMSLYRHARSRRDLEDAVVAALVAGVAPIPEGVAWDVQLRAWATGYRAMVLAHPNATPLLASRPFTAYSARRKDAETLLASLHESGLAPEEAALHLRAALTIIAGFAHLQAEFARAATTPPPSDPGPGPGEPLLALLLDQIGAPGDPERLFALVTDLVVDGIARRIEAGPAAAG
jgi:TetR/AcrR family tetracycline transcriptional repressor